MVVGLLPVTVLVGPLLPYGLMISVPIMIGGAIGVNVLKVSDGSLQLVLSVVCASVGLPALWAAFLIDPVSLRSRIISYRVVAASLLLGLMADAYWIRLAVFPGSNPFPDRLVTFFWALLLLAPFVVAVKYLYRLLRRPGPAV